MDWSKSKNIVLIVLIAMNILLLVIYGVKYESSINDNNDVYDYTMKMLKENKITLDCEVPENITKMPTITVKYSETDTGTIDEIIDNWPALKENSRDENGYHTDADNFLKKCGFLDENVSFESVIINKESAEVLYKNYHNDILLEECYMRVVYEKGKIVNLDRKWMEFVEQGDSKMRIMSPLTALLNFMSETDKTENIIINHMYMTYWIDPYNMESDVLYDTAFPAWCIVYNEKQVKYILAFEQ